VDALQSANVVAVADTDYRCPDTQACRTAPEQVDTFLVKFSGKIAQSSRRLNWNLQATTPTNGPKAHGKLPPPVTAIPKLAVLA
jgi:hypothetical protein